MKKEDEQKFAPGVRMRRTDNGQTALVVRVEGNHVHGHQPEHINNASKGNVRWPLESVEVIGDGAYIAALTRDEVAVNRDGGLPPSLVDEPPVDDGDTQPDPAVEAAKAQEPDDDTIPTREQRSVPDTLTGMKAEPTTRAVPKPMPSNQRLVESEPPRFIAISYQIDPVRADETENIQRQKAQQNDLALQKAVEAANDLPDDYQLINVIATGGFVSLWFERRRKITYLDADLQTFQDDIQAITNVELGASA